MASGVLFCVREHLDVVVSVVFYVAINMVNLLPLYELSADLHLSCVAIPSANRRNANKFAPLLGSGIQEDRGSTNSAHPRNALDRMSRSLVEAFHFFESVRIDCVWEAKALHASLSRAAIGTGESYASL